MSETTNGWPGKPGVPINADRDGWHWVKIIHGISQPRPRLWWSKIDRWELSDGALISPSEFAERWRYLGLVLTPDEAANREDAKWHEGYAVGVLDVRRGTAFGEPDPHYAALQKRCEEAERERDALRRDTSQQVTTDEMVRRLQHLGDWQAADRIEALQRRVAELEAENAGLSANQCLHSIHGDEAGNPYCPRIAELEAALQKRCEEAERERDALRRDASQEIATDELVRRLQHLGDWQAADRIEALQARADRNAAGFARVDAEAERAKFLHKQEIAALQKRVAELVEALGTLEKAASYTAKLGAVTGAHWLGLGTALIKARVALEGKEDE